MIAPIPQSRLILLMKFLALLLTALLACGPAAQPVQQRPGNLQVQAQQEEPTPTPTPLPTECITVRSDEGSPEEQCYTPKPCEPKKYSNLRDDLDDLAQRAEKQDAEGQSRGSSSTSSDIVRVTIQPADEVSGSKAKIIEWLKQRDIHYQVFDPHPYDSVAAAVPHNLLGPLSQLEAVAFVERPIVPVIPTPKVIEDPDYEPAP